mgnify:FL=1
MEKIFDKYVRETIANVEDSIDDASDRYLQLTQETCKVASENWKVVKTAVERSDEEVKVWLKIGHKKQGLFVNPKGIEVLEKRIPATKLFDRLFEFKQAIEFVRDNPNSEIAKEFHQEAILQARPRSKPQEKNKTDWRYDADADAYIAT